MQLSDEAQRRVAGAHADLVRAFAQVYEAGVGTGAFRDLPRPVVGQLMFQTVMGAGRTIMDAPDPKAQVHEIADIAIDFLIRGISL
jgi:hypothetical protein